MSVFAVADGSFVRSIGVGLSTAVTSGYAHDVVIADNGEIIGMDNHACTIRVFDCCGELLVCGWGQYGWTDGSFQHPAALSYVNGRLYVLDRGSPRVQVFE